MSDLIKGLTMSRIFFFQSHCRKSTLISCVLSRRLLCLSAIMHNCTWFSVCITSFSFISFIDTRWLIWCPQSFFLQPMATSRLYLFHHSMCKLFPWSSLSCTPTPLFSFYWVSVFVTCLSLSRISRFIHSHENFLDSSCPSSSSFLQHHISNNSVCYPSFLLTVDVLHPREATFCT